MDFDGIGIPALMGTLNGFKLAQDIFSLYVRFGRSYSYGENQLRFTVMPWAGGQADQSRGTGQVAFGPAPLPARERGLKRQKCEDMIAYGCRSLRGSVD
jgi:hypothetical protein